MDGTMRPLLITSINPSSNLGFQIKCFSRWKAAGFEARTINIAEEAEKLHAAGMPADEIRVIDTQDSGLSLFSKPVPLIKPVLESLAHEASHECYVISNSDVYPALRSASITSFWQKYADALALTREECITLDSHAFPDHYPYRGGLDTFFMTQEALKRLNHELSNFAASKRMAFGVPGWDYLMGACMLTPEINGRIADSRLLLHVSHRQAYDNIQEFANYVQAISRMGLISADGFAEAAAEFAGRIDAECQKSRHESRMARLIYFTPPPASTDNICQLSLWREPMERLTSLAPQLEGQYRVRLIHSLATHFATEQGRLQTVLDALLNSQSRLFQFVQALFAIAFSIHSKRAVEALHVSERYPPNNRHGQALELIMKEYPESDPGRRLEIAKLFGIELVDHRIYNRRLFNYLALSCSNDSERALLSEINKLVLGNSHVA